MGCSRVASRVVYEPVGFKPDYATHPGETLREVLAEHSLSQAELTRATGVSKKHISEILHGKAGVGPQMALALERVLHIDAGFWVRLQANHDLQRVRTAARDEP